jgi:phage terminase large subunit
MEGLVYPEFLLQTQTDSMAPEGKLVGGMDFGFNNPFAAIWGVLVGDILWIENEIYVRNTPISALFDRLPRKVLWVADPSGAGEIAQLKRAGFTVQRGQNDIRAGIAMVTARLQTQRLRVNAQRCPNLIREARLYRYPWPSERKATGENPVDVDNHALAALRYLICRLDARQMARYRRLPEATVNHDDNDSGAV